MGCHCEEGHCHGHEEEGNRLVLVFRCVIALILALLGHFLFSEEWLVAQGLGEVDALLINLGIMLVAYLLVAYDVIWGAIEGIVKEHEFFDEKTLMIVASIGAFVLRAFGPQANEFLEAVLVILLYQVGEMLEDLAEDKSKEKIVSAIDVREEKCRVETENGIEEKEAEELSIGDVCVYGVGMKILGDGLVVEGEGSIDESSLTGEAMPIHKAAGDRVNSLTVLTQGSIKVRVEQEYENSTAAKLLSLIEEASTKKSRVDRFITSFARVYTPIVALLAVLIAVVPPLILGAGNGTNWSRFVYAALSFLVVSCPCAIVISVPLAYFSGLGLASKKGILVKGAAYFDELRNLEWAVFDKTGTLTKGEFQVVETKIEGVDEALFKESLCALESRSSHPLAKVISSYLNVHFDEKSLSDYEEIPGEGVRAIYKGKRVSAGRKGGEISASEGGTIVYLNVENKCVGYVRLQDEIRENSKKFIEDLRGKGIKTALLSGDKESEVFAVKEALGIDEAYAELKPDEKVKALEQIQQKGTTLYVGDGINDAASIRLADIGIAMGGRGSDLAIECADCVLVGDDPSKIVSLINVATKTRRRAIFNIALSLTIKIGIMAVALIGSLTALYSLPLWVAAIGDTGVALLAILSSFLLGFSKRD